MQVEGTIEETASGTSRAVLVECSLSGIDDTLVTRKTCIGVRAEHQDLMATHLNLSSLLALNGAEIRIYVSLHKLLGLTIKLVSFL